MMIVKKVNSTDQKMKMNVAKLMNKKKSKTEKVQPSVVQLKEKSV